MEEIHRSRQPGGQGQAEDHAGDGNWGSIRAFIRDFRHKNKRNSAPIIADDGDVLNDNVKAMFVANMYMQNKR